jgi:hypothetical protein
MLSNKYKLMAFLKNNEVGTSRKATLNFEVGIFKKLRNEKVTSNHDCFPNTSDSSFM